ncbi:MAG: S-layer homology domain-containing protein [Deltaproteobacteria bacterium]
MQKWVCGVLVFVLLLAFSYLSPMKPADAVSFSDVGSGYWAASEIADLAGKGILNGYPDGTFKPDNNVTRAEFAKIIGLAMGYAPNSSASQKFPDVAQDHWAFGNIASAVDRGLVQGYPDGTFGPNRNVTKAEILTIIARAQNWSGGSGNHFNDVPSGYWAFAYIEACFANGVVKNPDPNIVYLGNLGPDEPATRAQTCVFTDRMIKAQGQIATTTKSKIAFTSFRDGNAEANTEIYIMNVDGTGQTRLTNNPAADMNPSFSPDGAKIAFDSGRDGGSGEIYIMNADGTGQTRLTNNKAHDGSPSFSPDGTKIAFMSNRDGNYEIYTMNADGTGQTRLTNNLASDGLPSFSPVGSKITFHSNRDGNYEIYIMNADGTEQTRLTNNQAHDTGASFSPDGSKIAFNSDRDGGNGEIYIMNVDGTGQTRLTNNQAHDTGASFSPDGSKIAFNSDRDGGNGEIYIMNVDGTGQTRLTNNPAGNVHPSFSPMP